MIVITHVDKYNMLHRDNDNKYRFNIVAVMQLYMAQHSRFRFELMIMIMLGEIGKCLCYGNRCLEVEVIKR